MTKSAKLISALVACMLLFTVAQPALAWSLSDLFGSGSSVKSYWRCTKCGKVADSGFGKFSAGPCNLFQQHEWVETISTLKDYQQKEFTQTVENLQDMQDAMDAMNELDKMGQSKGWW